SLLSDRDYTWNDNGELIRISSPRQTRSYSYSTTGRLTGVHTTAANLDIRIPYATDPAGNRLPDPELHPDSTLSMWPDTNTDPLGLEVFPRPFPLPIPWPKSPAQQQADDNAAKALTKWWNDTASQRIFDSLILNNPGLALDITMIASRGNVADTGITDRVNDIINDRFWSDGKKPDRCDVLQELIDCGDISAKDAKSTQKAWNCRHSRQSNDKKR
ncbi:TPA: polymorphic toxin type 34 domain-containing protein, partial [Escherichia coli]